MEDWKGFPLVSQSILWSEFVALCTPESTALLADKNTRNFPSGLVENSWTTVRILRTQLMYQYFSTTNIVSWANIWLTWDKSLCSYKRLETNDHGKVRRLGVIRKEQKKKKINPEYKNLDYFCSNQVHIHAII